MIRNNLILFIYFIDLDCLFIVISIEKIKLIAQFFKEIDNIQTDSGKIAPGETVDLKGIWDITVSPGDYIAKITINYDSNTEDFEKQFAIGAKNLSIEGILLSMAQRGRDILGKTVISEETGRNFGIVGDVVYVSESGELLNMIIADPSKHVVGLDLERDENNRIDKN